MPFYAEIGYREPLHKITRALEVLLNDSLLTPTGLAVLYSAQICCIICSYLAWSILHIVSWYMALSQPILTLSLYNIHFFILTLTTTWICNDPLLKLIHGNPGILLLISRYANYSKSIISNERCLDIITWCLGYCTMVTWIRKTDGAALHLFPSTTCQHWGLLRNDLS